MWTCFLTNTHGGRLVDPTIHSSSTGCSCMLQSQGRKKWSKGFVRPPARNPCPGCQGGCACHPACGIQDLLRRNKRAVQWGVPAEETAQSSTMWARMGAGHSQWHLVLHGRVPPVKGVLPWQKEIKNGDPPEPLCPTTKTRSHKEDSENMTSMTVNLPRPGRPTDGHWWPPTCLKKGSKDWANQPCKWGRVTASAPIGGATQEGNCRDVNRGALRP